MMASILNLRAPRTANFRLLFGVNGWRCRDAAGLCTGPHPFRWTVSNLSFRPL